MATTRFSRVVTTEDELRAVVGYPGELAVKKERPRLEARARAFIARSPFALVATCSAAGRCDVSPKGDRPGFATVLDDRTLVIPDRPGNRRVDSMRNLLENPGIGLLFLMPGVEYTLRVNGRGWVIRDEEHLERAAVGGKRPQLAIGVEVEEVFLHCGKAFKRSRLWEPDTWPERADIVCDVIADYAAAQGRTAAEVAESIEEGYRTRMW
jgi:PPOX class probable FMN-dependent enzyme